MEPGKRSVNTLDAKMTGSSKTRRPATDRLQSLHVEGKGRKDLGDNVTAFGQKQEQSWVWERRCRGKGRARRERSSAAESAFGRSGPNFELGGRLSWYSWRRRWAGSDGQSKQANTGRTLKRTAH